MRTIIAFVLTVACAAADAPRVHITVTADDLQNLVACARRTLPSLTPQEIVIVAQAIAHAEESVALLRAPQPVPAPDPKAKEP